MELENKKNVQNWIIRTINDPLVKILLENSQFTKIQFETLLIDMLVEKLIDKKLTNKEKAKIRLHDKVISRGSYNRSLQQARQNMNSSIWTVLLLGYVGILNNPSLNPFIETSNKLESYIKEYNYIRNKLKKSPKDENMAEMVVMIQNNLKKALLDIISPGKMFL